MTQPVITLTQGLLGLEAYTRFTLAPFEDGTPFFVLQSTETEQLSFIVTEPALLVGDYGFDLSDEDVAELQITGPDDVYVLILLTIPDDPQEMTANLLGPMVINKRLNLGKQVVLHGTDWPVRFRVFGEAQAETAETAPSAAKGGT